jgi:uridylate kinase
MDMFDLFRETDEKKTVESPPETDSPPIQPSTSESAFENDSPEDAGLFTKSSSDDAELTSFPSTLAPSSRETISNALVIAIPGSTILRGNSFQLAWLSRLAPVIDALRASGTKVAVVVGESPDVRVASRAAHQLSLHPTEISQAMRASSGLNASLVLRTLSQAHPQVCEEIRETVSLLQSDVLPVMLGSKDTLSMEARAAMLAESVNAKFVLFSDMDIPSNTLHHGRFSKMASEAAFKSNQQFIVDPLTALVLARSKVDALLLSDKHVSKLESILKGESSEGTWVTSQTNSVEKVEKTRD